MEAKKNGRITIKSLSEEFNKEVKYLKETVTNLGKRLNDSETKINILEEKLSKNQEVFVKDGKECYKCDEKFTNISELNKHVQRKHPRTFECNVCDRKSLVGEK